MNDQDDVATVGEHLWRVLARPGSADSVTEARAASAAAAALAGDRLDRDDPEGALDILETASGLALYAAVEARPVARLLADAGKPHLARQWQAAAGVADPHTLPADLRREVLATLTAHSTAAALLTPPTVTEIRSALAGIDADALVHLIPGHAVLTPVSGPVVHLPLATLTPGAEPVGRFRSASAVSRYAAGPPDGFSEAGTAVPDKPVDRWPVNGSAAVRPWAEADRQGSDDDRRWPVESGAPHEWAIPFRPVVPSWPAVPFRPALASPASRPDAERGADASETDGGWPDRSGRELAEALEQLGRWAWAAVIGPLLDHLTRAKVDVSRRPGRVPHIVLVVTGELADVPWSAARRADGTYAVELLAISQASSARLLCHTAARPPLPPSRGGLVLADPDPGGCPHDLIAARREAYAIQRALYPRARFTGRRPDGTVSPSGAGTLDQVRAWLTTSSPAAGGILHLACAGSSPAGERAAAAPVGGDRRGAAYVRLAGGERLSVREVFTLAGRARRPIDLVVLAGGEISGLGTAFLAGGVRSVLASGWSTAPALLFMAHLFRRSGRPVWAALRAAQLWMLDPHRAIPPEMPADLAATVRAADATSALGWAAVSHWGR